MAETVIDKNLAKERLEKFLCENDVSIAHTRDELYARSVKDGDGEKVKFLMRKL